jgi:P-type Cu2+ transporter
MQRIERALGAVPGVASARVNLSAKRVTVHWRTDGPPPPLVETLGGLGYPAHLHDPAAAERDGTLSKLVRALAVAGFAAGNIMLLSVSIWSGAEPATRDLFHWLSAAIALPALAYSGRIFFGSAWAAVRRGRTNMDVPISIGVLLAFGMSLYDTVHHGPHAYFDAAISLLFFLLAGRTLDHMMRDRARATVKGLVRLIPRGAMIVHADGRQEYVPVDQITPGMTILLPVGERVPVNARVAIGSSELDCSLASGESAPQPVTAGSALQAGTLNLTSPLTITATAAAADSFLAEMIRLMEVAEASRSPYRRIADRAARLYAPVVHLTALLAFAGWLGVTGDVHRALTIAVAVLIITCPCALGLAVPMVQVAAARRLFERGIMVKDGGALERLSEIRSVVFDKTGTLTLGIPQLYNADTITPAVLDIAATMGAHSRHPYARTLATAGGGAADIGQVIECAGYGLEARSKDGSVYRLGRPEWTLSGEANARAMAADANAILSKDGRLIQAFRFTDRTRPGARETLTELSALGLSAEIVSGDRAAAVQSLAAELCVDRYAAEVTPEEKIDRVRTLTVAGCKPLMVGDGLNDAPALAAAHVSMAPASAADVSRNAADFVFLREDLSAVSQAVTIARAAARLVRQNFVLAIAYNAIAVPIALSGYVTPLIAALAMSLSSIIVICNSQRLNTARATPPMPDGAASLRMKPAPAE